MSDRPPTDHERFVQAALWHARQTRPERHTIITGTGARHRARPLAEKGERILYGPHGQPVRLIEWEGGNQIEEDEHLHAIVRPSTRFTLRDLQR